MAVNVITDCCRQKPLINPSFEAIGNFNNACNDKAVLN